jgi:hypothetical protein
LAAIRHRDATSHDAMTCDMTVICVCEPKAAIQGLVGEW